MKGLDLNANLPNVIRLVASGRLDLRPIITARSNLEQVVDAISRSGSRSDGGIMVHPIRRLDSSRVLPRSWAGWNARASLGKEAKAFLSVSQAGQ
jgi:hypothetical protein